MKKFLMKWYRSRSLKRSARQSVIDQVSGQSYSLAAIYLEGLIAAGMKGIILDLDNTIISEDDRYLAPGAEAWIEQAKQLGFKLFILSNGKRHYRVRYWSARLALPAIHSARKPFPASFRRAMQQMQLPPRQVVVIGDSRHTDVLGAWIVGCLSIQVASLPHPPRWWEKMIGSWVQMPYKKADELLPFDSSYF